MESISSSEVSAILQETVASQEKIFLKTVYGIPPDLR